MTFKKFALINFSEDKLFSLFFLTSLTSALFFTGNNTWFFTASYILIIINLALVLNQRFYKPITLSLNGIVVTSILLLIWFAILIFPSQIKYLSIYNFFWMGSILVVFLTLTLSENKDKIWNLVWPIILFLVLIWAFYGLVQYYFLHVKMNASFLNRNSLSALINLVLIPAVGYFLLDEKYRPSKLINDKTLPFILFFLFLTDFIIASRGALLSLLIGFCIFSFILHKNIPRQKFFYLIKIIVAALLFTVLSQYLIHNLPHGFAGRIMELKSMPHTGHLRLQQWESLIPVFNEMPWHGLGLGSLWLFWPPYRNISDTSAGYFAHNDYIQILLEAGYPGLILLFSLFIFILLALINKLKNEGSTPLSLLHRFEIVSLFSTLITLATHSFLTYNFYILPLLLIAGLFLARFNQLTQSSSVITLPYFKTFLSPVFFYISLISLIFVLLTYFLTLSLSSTYNNRAKELMLENKLQESSRYFLKAQKLAPLMDNPFFSYADLLRRGANSLYSVNKNKQANSLIKLAHLNLDKALSLNPLRSQSHHIRGLIYERSEPEKAKIEFNKALKLDPRFLFSRIRLSQLLYKENNLKAALRILRGGVNYNYPDANVLIEYMQLFAKLSREAGDVTFALELEKNITKIIHKIRSKTFNLR